MGTKHLLLFTVTATIGLASPLVAADVYRIPAETLRDKIRGGLLGQILGNLNGLPHENKYVEEPGSVESYTPALPQGAWTDDDTDFEWVYILEMQRRNELFLSPEAIADLWRERINRRIWCSNQYARQLMGIGMEPPHTGRFAFNPWADFNISGQFICETFGLIAPAMPQSAARLGLNYTTVTIDFEPAQTTQMFTTMIATAFTTDDISIIYDAGMKALDPASEILRIAKDLLTWHREFPDDWRTTRRRMKEKYTQAGGSIRDVNGHELNTAVTLGALLYGKGDVPETLRLAFNMGWDCDNSAATAGTIVGVMRGYRSMMSQGWTIVDRYQNTTRQNMPMDETITSFADRIIELSERLIIEKGGSRRYHEGTLVYEINAEQPKNVYALPRLQEQIGDLQLKLGPRIEQTIKASTDPSALALAAYRAICLDMVEYLRAEYPVEWKRALAALQQQDNVVQAIYYYCGFEAGERLRAKANAAGLKKPAQRVRLWE